MTNWTFITNCDSLYSGYYCCIIIYFCDAISIYFCDANIKLTGKHVKFFTISKKLPSFISIKYINLFYCQKKLYECLLTSLPFFQIFNYHRFQYCPERLNISLKKSRFNRFINLVKLTFLAKCKDKKIYNLDYIQLHSKYNFE